MEERLSALEKAIAELIRLVQILTNNAKQQLTYTTKEAAARLGVKRLTVAEHCNHGGMLATKIPDTAGGKGEWRIDHDELERFKREGKRRTKS